MPSAGIVIPKVEFVKRLKARIGEGIFAAIDTLEHSDFDPNKMDPVACNTFLSMTGIKINKTELENLFDHFGSGPDAVDLAAFFAELEDDAQGETPVFYLTETTKFLMPESPYMAHLSLSGTAHVGFDAQYKPFPKHWGAPPNAQLKGHDGIMRTLPGGYGKGNAPMARWVKANMEKDAASKTTVKGVKPYPFGNYSLGCLS